MKRYPEAISAGQSCLEVSKAIGDTKGETGSLILSGETYLLLNQSEDASNCFITASEVASQSDDKDIEATSNFKIGKSFFSNCEYDKAIIHIQKAIEIAEENDIDSTYFHKGLAESYLKIRENDCALAHCLKCLKSSKRIENKHAEMDAYAMLGSIFEMMEQHKHALLNTNKAIAIMGETGIKHQELELYSQQGKYNKALNRYTDAIESFQKCANIARITGNKQYEADCYGEISNSYEFINQFGRAVEYGRKFLRIARDTGDVDDLLGAHLSLGIAHFGMNQYEDAYSNLHEGKKLAEAHNDIFYAKEFQERLDMISKSFGLKQETVKCINVSRDGNECLCQFTCNELDQTHLDKYKESMKQCNYKETITNLRDHLKGFDNHPYYHGNARVHCLLEIALLHKHIHQFEKALQCCQEALSIANQLGSQHLQARCKNMEGDLYFPYLGRIGKTISAYQKAIHYFDLMFDPLDAEREEIKISLLEMYAHCYTDLIQALVCNRQLEKAFMVCDHRRARALKDLLCMYNMDCKLLREDKLEFSDIKGLVSSSAFAILSYVDQVCSNCNSVYNFVINKDRGLQFIIVSGEKTSCQSMQHHIYRAYNEIQIVGQDMKCENRSASTCHDDGESNDEVGSTHTQLQTRTRKPRGDDDTRPEDTRCHCKLTGLKMLHHLLISRPMCSAKGSKKQKKERRTRPCQPSQEELVIIPDGQLYNVPFAALQDPDTGEYLSETKRIRIAPSIATLKLLMERPDDFECKTGALIIGDPEVGKVIYDGKEREFSTLFLAYAEALEINRIFRDQILLREKATKAAVLERLQKGVSVVHIATHGDAKKATIVLAPSPEVRASKIPEEEDYMLTMADVQKAKVRAKLVVLSCCHSGRGEIKAEGVVGMCRAFLASGARSVVASQWAIDDDATLEFMKEFYRNLKEKKSASLSLQLAMRFMRKQPKYNYPRYWAPFFLMGDDVVIDVNQST